MIKHTISGEDRNKLFDIVAALRAAMVYEDGTIRMTDELRNEIVSSLDGIYKNTIEGEEFNRICDPLIKIIVNNVVAE